MEKKMENEMETGIMHRDSGFKGYVGILPPNHGESNGQ